MIAILAVSVLAAGCGGNEQLLSPPTLTPTHTLPPTITPEQQVVADAPTPQPTIPTLAPATRAPVTRPATTPTAGPSPTDPLAPTFSPAPMIHTATRVPTLAGVEISYFTTYEASTTPGENVTLLWDVRGVDYAYIYRLNADGEKIHRWDVSASGEITVRTRAEDGDVARFLLEATTRDVTVEQPLLIPMRCDELWFFDPPSDLDGCPAGPPQPSTQAEQVFERGRMIWVENLDRIYVIFEDGQSPRWAQYEDEFEEGQPERDGGLVPPAPNLVQPIRGFGLVWRSYPRIQERLEWAITPELPFDGMYQADSPEASVATLYLRMHEGNILALDSLTGEWEVLPLIPQNE